MDELIPNIETTLYRLNGTLMTKGAVGAALNRIADELEKLNVTTAKLIK